MRLEASRRKGKVGCSVIARTLLAVRDLLVKWRCTQRSNLPFSTSRLDKFGEVLAMGRVDYFWNARTSPRRDHGTRMRLGKRMQRRGPSRANYSLRWPASTSPLGSRPLLRGPRGFCLLRPVYPRLMYCLNRCVLLAVPRSQPHTNTKTTLHTRGTFWPEWSFDRSSLPMMSKD